jgi:hypothetical protein
MNRRSPALAHVLAVFASVSFVTLVPSVSNAQEQEEITRLLQQYVAIDTSNPPPPLAAPEQSPAKPAPPP